MSINLSWQRFGVFAVLVFGLALIVRLMGLGDQSLWFDEEFTLRVKSISLDAIYQHTLVKEAKPPLYFYFINFWTQFGQDTFWLRLPSAIFGSLAAAFLFLWLRKEAKLNASLVWGATVWMILSPMSIYYSQEGRMYSLMLLLAVTFVGLACRYLQTGKISWLVGVLMVGIISCYSFTYGFLIPGFGVVLGASLWLADPALRQRCQLLFGGSVLAGLSFLPWLISAFNAAQQQQFLDQGGRGRGSFLETTAYCFYTLGYGLTSGIPMTVLRSEKKQAFMSHPIDGVFMVAGIVLLLWIICFGLLCLWRQYRFLFFVALSGLAVFGGGPAAIDLLSERVINNPRYGVMAVPFLALCFGAVFQSIQNQRWRGWVSVAFGGFAFLVLVGAWNNFKSPVYQRDDFKSAAEYLRNNPHKPTGTLLCAGSLIAVYRYYNTEMPVWGVGMDTLENFPKRKEEILKFVKDHRKFGLILSRLDYGDKNGLLLPWIDSEFERIESQDFPGIKVLILKRKAAH